VGAEVTPDVVIDELREPAGETPVEVTETSPETSDKGGTW
jgi:hypothetical protein